MNISVSGQSQSGLDDSSTERDGVPKIAVVYHFLPHFRKAVFSELMKSKNYDFHIYYGENRVADTIKTSDGLDGAIKLPVTRIGPFYWQSGVFSNFPKGRYQAVIFLGDVHIITYWIAAVRARLQGSIVLFWTLGWLRNETGIRSFIRSRFYRLADGLLIYGERARSIGLKKGFRPDKMKVIFNSLDYEVQRVVRRRLEEEEAGPDADDHFKELAAPFGGIDRPYFLYIGRLVKRVRLDLAIKALKQVNEKNGRDIALVLIGDGPARRQLEELSTRDGVKVNFLGAQYKEKTIGAWIYRARAVVGPGKVGLTAMHSLAYGVPVITHQNFDEIGDEVQAIEPGITGDLFRQNDVEHLAQILEKWLQKPQTREEREAAIKTIEASYTPARQVELIEEELTRLLSGDVKNVPLEKR